ncbi:MAG TPA: nicotinate (nicotinamide) nucleotide adenylyltransferase [Sulfurovum sp.]|nr:nicotinate (nicotinamide) nucleotide adenylyltransferase [Sulfurovum sp.]
MVNQTKPTVAIFGGSFDPPHKAHQRIVAQAVENLEIDKLIVVPAYLNPFKTSSLASAQKRLAWCHTLFDEIPNVIVDDYEIKQGRSTTTSQSVKHFNRLYNVQYIIIGSDNLSTLTKWHEFGWLNRQVTWVIFTREGHAVDTDMLLNWKVLHLNEKVSSTQIRDDKTLENIDKKIENSVKQILKDNNI